MADVRDGFVAAYVTGWLGAACGFCVGFAAGAAGAVIAWGGIL